MYFDNFYILEDIKCIKSTKNILIVMIIWGTLLDMLFYIFLNKLSS